jgi:uncharacterized RDD family membrane protein YckC
LSTFGSAQYNTSLDSVYNEVSAPASALKREVAERLAAHRDRTHRRSVPTLQPPPEPAGERATRIAAAVAERYAKSQTYRAFLAAEAERAVQQSAAEAAAEARYIEAIAYQQRRLLADLEAESTANLEAESQLDLCVKTTPQPELLTPSKPSKPGRQGAAARPAKAESPDTALASEHTVPVRDLQSAGLKIRLFEGSEPNRSLPPRGSLAAHPQDRPTAADLAEALALDEEIAFRHDPVFEEAPEPAMPLPANLIEFPRQLVAARKARPRHAEGPLLSDAGEEPGLTQLRIFEVKPAHISPAPPVEAAAPEWSSIWLDAIAPNPLAAEAFTAGSPTQQFDAADIAGIRPITLESTRISGNHPRPVTATIRRRLLAAALDGGLVLVALVTFTAGFALVTAAPAGSVPSLLADQIGIPASCLAVAVALGFLYVAYHLLFCSLTQGTPGMRCARIAFCTFSDDSPTRAAMRRRVAALLLSACPLGLGFLWAILDEDRLGWHDRITGIYPRQY